MLNPLSVQYGQHISGKEINDWCHDQIENNGSHVKDAKRLLAKNYRDDVMYRLSWKAETSGAPMGHTIEFDRVDKYEKRKGTVNADG